MKTPLTVSFLQNYFVLKFIRVYNEDTSVRVELGRKHNAMAKSSFLKGLQIPSVLQRSTHMKA